ncbi:MAG: hypothetical protein ISN29_11425, partial [Gammaproteobacteria bacterium AqS3]|nr:hypothetical protein [Gammaproteobacteria bacterium AqS3]
MKNPKAFSPAVAPLPSESRTESATCSHSPRQPQPPPSASLSRRLLLAGALLLSGLALSVPSHAVPGFVYFDTPVQVQEGESGEFRVKLMQQPTANVSVAVSTSNEAIWIHTDGTSLTLTFTSENWDTYQRVRLQGRPDSNADDETSNVLLTATGGGYDGVNGSVEVTVLDDDLLEIVSTGSAVMVEGGEGSSITFRLSRQPAANMTITLGWADGAYPNPDIDIDTDPDTDGHQNTVIFTTSNWNVNRTAAIIPQNDSDSNMSVGVLYVREPNGFEHRQMFVVYDDEVEMTVSATSLTISEGGTGTFTVSMSSPAGDLNQTTLYITESEENSDITFSPNQLYFNKLNWTTPRTVTVRAAQDSDINDDSTTIRISDNLGVLNASVAVSVTDDDEPTVGLTLSANELSLNEGNSTTFTVRLTAHPKNPRSVNLASNNTDVTTTPATLNFSTSNWNTAQTVTVSAARDDDGVNDSATINLTGVNITSASVGVSVIDDDAAIGLALTPDELALNEG